MSISTTLTFVTSNKEKKKNIQQKDKKREQDFRFEINTRVSSYSNIKINKLNEDQKRAVDIKKTPKRIH